MGNITTQVSGISSIGQLNNVRVFKVPLKIIQLEYVKFVRNKQNNLEFNPVHSENIKYR